MSSFSKRVTMKLLILILCVGVFTSIFMQNMRVDNSGAITNIQNISDETGYSIPVVNSNIALDAYNSSVFVSQWDTTKISTGSSASNQIQLPLLSTGNYSFTIDWGDNSTDYISTYNQAETLAYIYSIRCLYNSN